MTTNALFQVLLVISVLAVVLAPRGATAQQGRVLAVRADGAVADITQLPNIQRGARLGFVRIDPNRREVGHGSVMHVSAGRALVATTPGSDIRPGDLVVACRQQGAEDPYAAVRGSLVKLSDQGSSARSDLVVPLQSTIRQIQSALAARDAAAARGVCDMVGYDQRIQASVAQLRRLLVAAAPAPTPMPSQRLPPAPITQGPRGPSTPSWAPRPTPAPSPIPPAMSSSVTSQAPPAPPQDRPTYSSPDYTPFNLPPVTGSAPDATSHETGSQQSNYPLPAYPQPTDPQLQVAVVPDSKSQQSQEFPYSSPEIYADTTPTPLQTAPGPSTPPSVPPTPRPEENSLQAVLTIIGKVAGALKSLQAAADKGSTGTVNGAVHDAIGRPLPGARVTAVEWNQTASTGSDGTFSLQGPAGRVTIEVTAAGYQDLNQVTEATSGGLTRHEFTLQAR